jgi:ubiquinone/menaquinone biosynthesis C-methylase UbiE
VTRTRLPAGTDVAQQEYTAARIAHWDDVAASLDTAHHWSGAYHARLTKVFRSLVPPNQRVLEIGCGQGDLLAALKPGFGLGVDFSGNMLRRAARRHPHLSFARADAHALDLSDSQAFDVVILSDVVNDLWDVEVAFGQLKRVTRPGSRLILNFYSRLWEVPLDLTRALGMGKPLLEQNWLTVQDVDNLLRLADFEVTRRWDEILLPIRAGGLEEVANRYLARVWPLEVATLTHFVVARPTPRPDTSQTEPLVSVIVPARNESGNISAILDRTPEMGRGTELVFVEGHSSDATYETIERAIASRPERQCQLLRQTGKGKGDAVRMGFAHARGDVLMILDADLTVAPEDLPRFLNALRSGKGEFINGVRLVYPMQKQAMRFFNLLGNKFFSLAFSWLLGQSIKDTLCGTKVLAAANYQRIAAERAYFGDFDPFGDFDLLFGAARLNLKIVDLPIRYRERTYGTTNIQRWRHGWLLLRMVLFAARRIKFV